MDVHVRELLRTTASALLVIDVQNDYIHPQGSAGRGGRDTSAGIEMMPRVHRLIAAARERRVPVFFLRNWHTDSTNSAPRKALLEATRHVRAETAVAGTWGAEWYEVAPEPDEIVVNKFRYDGFLGTPLETMLRTAGIETVICIGTATNVCVESTARAAHMRDFHLVLVGDCCAAFDRDLHDATLKNVQKHFGYVATAEEVEAAWPVRQDADHASALSSTAGAL